MASRGCGSYQKRINEVNDIDFRDFVTPWNFFAVFLSDDRVVIKWLQEHGLLLNNMYCIRCNNADLPMRLQTRKSCIDGVTWRCVYGHELSIRRNSFFEKSHISLRDIMLFVYEFLKHQTLWKTSLQTNFSYRSTAVDWANFVRDIFRQYTNDVVFNMKFSGDIEVDESIFGRRSKNNMGARKGCRVWIVGIVERSSKRIILYPVECRPEEVLIRLIDTHVEKGSRIYTDGWAAYGKLNEHGYQHFTVIHSYQFTRKYVNIKTGEEVICHINSVEGAWAHAKKHFRTINGCSLSTFEGHLAEVMWRNHVSTKNGNEYEDFFALLKQYYPLNEACKLANCANLYDTWNTDGGEITADCENADGHTQLCNKEVCYCN